MFHCGGGFVCWLVQDEFDTLGCNGGLWRSGGDIVFLVGWLAS